MGKFLKKFIISAFGLLLLSCSEEFLKLPVSGSNGENGAALIADKISAPVDLTATHGKKGTISLQWKSVKGAVKYEIFSAESPFSEFKKSGETRDNFFEFKTESGINRYFKVVAENYVKSRSKDSNIAFGSTMATPFITSIVSNSNGLSAKINWWMSNCSSETYEENIIYEVFAYSEDLKTVVSSARSEKNSTEAVIEGLSPKTNYRFQVQAYLQSDQNNVEKSDLVDEETARRLVPAAPEQFKVSQGEFADKVELTWVLPDYVDVSLGNKTYESHGLYFVVSRKEKGEDDTAYRVLAKINPLEYVPGNSASYTDSSIDRGVQYVYKIQSYTADVPKEISSETSIAVDEGWIVSEAAIYVEGNYESEENFYTAISFSYKTEFESFGVNYSYFLKEQRTPLSGDQVFEPVYVKFDSQEKLAEYTRSFDDIKGSEGYYTYSLIICKEGTEEYTGSESLIQTMAPGKFIVTDDLGSLPVINEFTVKDRFKNKFILNWDYNEDYAYILHWLDDDSNEKKIEFERNDARLKIDGGKAEYVHAAESGETRIYTLEASNGLSKLVNDDTRYLTLGTAEPEFEEADYESISFRWKKVQAADDSAYKVHAYYSDDEGKAELLPDYIITENDDEMTCIISQPAGWNDSKLAGKEVTVEIVSKNETNDETSSSSKTRLLGPALAQTKVTAHTATDISVVWNKIEDAAGYIIYRSNYSDGKGTILKDVDEIYVSADGKTILSEEESVNTPGANRALVTEGETTLTFKDIYAEPSNDTSKYQVNQSKIAWGLPYGYFVVPVKNVSDRPSYTNFEYAKGAAYGYGLNVKASKAEYGNKVVVTWEQPYNAESKTASLYRRRAGSEQSNWEHCTVLGKSSEAVISAENIISGIDVKLNAYEYAVLYNGTGGGGNVFAASYEKDLLSSEKKDKDSPLEQSNKGYTLGIANISAQKAGGYDETVNWSVWNYAERNIGPDYYEIQIKNLNNKNDWVTVAKITPDVKVTDGEFKINDDGRTAVPVNAAANGIESLSSDVCSATLTPAFTEDNFSNGVLKVLRDARHFYRLKAYRTLSDGSIAEATVGDDSVYVYREITKQELVRCTNFVIADALYKAGIPYKTVNGSSTKKTDGAEGSFSITGAPVGGLNYKNKVTWDFNTYKAKWSSGFCSTDSGNVESFLSLDSEASSSSEVGIDGNALNFAECQLYYLPALDIKVTSSVPLDSYKGTVNVTIGSSGNKTVWNMTANLNGEQIKKISGNENDFYKWFPYALGSTITPSSNVDANFKTYQSPWWE